MVEDSQFWTGIDSDGLSRSSQAPHQITFRSGHVHAQFNFGHGLQSHIKIFFSGVVYLDQIRDLGYEGRGG